MTGIELGRGKRRKVERGLRRQEILQTFLVLCFSFPLLSFFLYQACKLLPSLPFSSALLPTPPPLLPLFAKDGHKMLWTGCKKVIALSPTLTYMYMYTGVRYSWTATTAISLQQPPLQWPLFWPTVYTVNLVSTSLQWPLSSVPKVLVAERFNCNEKKFSDCQLLSLYIMNLHVFM